MVTCVLFAVNEKQINQAETGPSNDATARGSRWMFTYPAARSALTPRVMQASNVMSSVYCAQAVPGPAQTPEVIARIESAASTMIPIVLGSFERLTGRLLARS
jgi:hypothetical protein